MKFIRIVVCAAVTALAVAPLAATPPTRASAADAIPCPIARHSPDPVATATTMPPPPQTAASQVGGARLSSTGLITPDGGAPLPNSLTARSWVIADLDTGAIVAACAPHVYKAPASVQKLLLAATVLPKLDPNMDVKITAGDLDFEEGSSAVGLLRNGTYKVSLLWLGLFLNSGNDAANTLARLGGGGGPDGIANTMREANELAHRIGARDSHAVTPHGLDAPGQWTSAYDLALIARLCYAREDFRRYIGTREAKVPAQPRATPADKKGYQIQNDNGLLWNYPGALGGKVGYTDFARHTFVGAAQRGGRTLVATILDAESNPARGWQQAADLLDWGFARPASSPGVGRLVTAEELAPTPSPAAMAAGPKHADGSPAWAWLVVGIAAVGAAAAGGAGFWLKTLRRR